MNAQCNNVIFIYTCTQSRKQTFFPGKHSGFVKSTCWRVRTFNPFSCSSHKTDYRLTLVQSMLHTYVHSHKTIPSDIRKNVDIKEPSLCPSPQHTNICVHVHGNTSAKVKTFGACNNIVLTCRSTSGIFTH